MVVPEPHLTLSHPLPQVSPEYPLLPSAVLLALLLTVLAASSFPWLTLSPPYCYYLNSFLSCFGAGDQIFFLPLVRSSPACSSFQWDSLSCHTCETSSGSPQRSHILPRKVQDRLTGSILEDRIHDGTANPRLGEPHCKRAVCVLSRYVRLFASPWTVAQAKRLEWVAISSCKRSPLPRDWNHRSCHISCIAGRFFTTSATWEAHKRTGIP